jgi:hypothetical protein
VAGDEAGGAEAGDRAEAEADDGDEAHVLAAEVQPGGGTDAAGQVGAAGRFDCFHRAAAAGALDHADDGHAVFRRHALDRADLFLDGGVGGGAADGEVIARDHDGTAVNQAAAGDAVGGREVDQVAVGVVFGFAGDGADFVEGATVEQAVDAFAHVQAAALALAVDAGGAAHFASHCLAGAQFVEFRLPAHFCHVPTLSWPWYVAGCALGNAPVAT